MKTVSLALVCGLTISGCINGVNAVAQVQAPVRGVPAVGPTSVADRSKALSKLFAEIWEDRLKHAPEYASYLGDKRYNDQLTDYSVQAVNASLERGRGFIERLSEIDTTGLTEQEQLSAKLMLRDLIDEQEGAKFKEWQMPVNQFGGFHTEMPRMVENLSFETVKDYDDYIARLKKIPTAFSQIMTNMQLGMDEGRMPPKYLLEKVLVQTQTLADQKPEESPFARPLKKFPATISAADQKRISGELMEAISTQVLPAYQRFAKFLKVAYIPAGRKDAGVWALPDGDAYYAYRIRQSTTLNKSAEEIHQIGLDEVKRNEAEMLAIVHKLGYPDLKSFRAALQANPKEHPASKEALLDAYKGYIAQMEPKLPGLFGTLPKAKVEVVAMPSYIEKDQAAAFYDQGSPDGKRPGRVDVNTYNFADRSMAPVEAVAYHEGVPGHHLQISIAQELTGLPEFRKQEYYTAYTEGWGLYSERLGKEIGFYQDPYSDYGRLENDTWRAIRLVVDTGVHAKHWTREQMVDFFREHSAIDETNIQAEVDRYIAWPGQALGYKMGQLKILELRQRAQTALGAKFDLKAFHDVVLDAGALPMDVLEQRVDAWIAAQKKVVG
ncbi:uncharacterized protein (DUF885 family) [Edaphobacter aggregans]|uniref:Uncharacterized protein (DUF885 family) n=1 Tax=Edaphobacter aggregans TaxID=570835 RepID=A0A3R9QD23_9BACT|nr:DUF885 domain-containing protein [Edaphobacter aggregans]RSL18785.1 uncharacterized protein (DUF885 family) [Edaphobacter aggregans]